LVWVFSNLEPAKVLALSYARRKIEQIFRGAKGLLEITKAMPKRFDNLEKLIAFMLLAYVVGLLVSETVRNEVY